MSDEVTLVAGERDATIDAGFYEPRASLGDYVWNDKNANGIQDDGETGINGVTVRLLSCAGAELNTTVTGAGGPNDQSADVNGFYEFTGLEPGCYKVMFDQPAGFEVSPRQQGGNPALDSDGLMSDEVTLAAGERNATIDAGFIKVCEVCIGVNQLTLKITAGANRDPNERIRVRENGLGGAVLYDSYNDGDSNPTVPTGGSFSFSIPNPGTPIVVTVKGANHPTETVKATFLTDCNQAVGTSDGNSYITFEVTALTQHTEVDETGAACRGLVCGQKFEAENGKLSGMFQIFQSSGFSGGAYVKVPNSGSEPIVNELTDSYVEYKLTLDQAKQVKIQTGVRGPNGSDNSFWVTIDGQPAGGYLYDTPSDGVLQSDYVNDRNGRDDGDPVMVSLSAGEHTIRFYLREDGTKLDWVKAECSMVPNDCTLQVEKTCEIATPPQPEVLTCNDLKDVTGLAMIWNGVDGVTITTELGQVISDVNNGDLVLLNTPKDQTGNDVDVTISGAVNGSSQFHISCSDNEMNGYEDCGTAQGNGKDNKSYLLNDFIFGGMTGQNGQFTCPQAQASGGFPTESVQCEFTPQEEAASCDALKDVNQLTMVWDGPDGVNMTTELGQVINGVNHGDVVVFEAPKSQTGNDVDVFLTGTVTGTSRFHISCSDNAMDGPEDCGTRQGNGKDNKFYLINDFLFGGMGGDKGEFGCPGTPSSSAGTDVVFGIRVNNPNPENLMVQVIDAKLGISETQTIAANSSYELVTDPVFILPDGTNVYENTVVVTGETVSGASCAASDSVRVKRLPQPVPCAECSGKVTTLTLKYLSATGAVIKVKQKNGVTVFNQFVAANGDFSFIGTDKGTLGTEIYLYINGTKVTTIHTSCSQDIGPGMVFGSFLVVSGESKDGGLLCPLP